MKFKYGYKHDSWVENNQILPYPRTPISVAQWSKCKKSPPPLPQSVSPTNQALILVQIFHVEIKSVQSFIFSSFTVFTRLSTVCFSIKGPGNGYFTSISLSLSSLSVAEEPLSNLGCEGSQFQQHQESLVFFEYFFLWANTLLPAKKDCDCSNCFFWLFSYFAVVSKLFTTVTEM